MPIEQEDQDSYSIDEIMERLRDRGKRNEPELVTRPDGSQVIKVRRRKRRTRQPHKEAERKRQRARIIQISSAVALLLLLAGTIVGMFAYYNSRAFTDSLRGKIAAWSGAEVEFTQFRVTPVSSGAASMTCRWGDGNPLRELALRNISADLRLTSFVSSRWSGEEVLANSGTLKIGAADPSAPWRLSDPPEDGSQIPFSFIRYRCQDFSLIFGESPRPAMRLRDVEASYSILSSTGRLLLNGGVLSVWGWPDLPLERGLIQYTDGQLEVSSLRIGSGMNHEFKAEIEGSLDPRSTQPASLDVRLQRFPMSKLAGDNVARLLDVTIDSDATLSFVPGEFDSYELVAPFSASVGTEGAFIDAFAFLDVLRSEFPDEDIGSRDRPFGAESEGLLRRKPGEIALESLRLVAKNQLAVRGDIRVGEKEALSGTLAVGVAERLALSHPSPNFLKVFGESMDGFRWTQVELSGTIHNPADDFARRVREIVAQGASETPTGSSGGRKEELEEEFQDLIEGR